MSSPYGTQGDNSGFAAPHNNEPGGYGASSYGQQGAYGGNPYGATPSYDSYAQQGYGQTPYQAPYASPLQMAPQTNGLATASLVLSLCGLAVGITAPIGLILGIVARSQIKNEPQRYSGEGLALGGIIAGAIITALYVLMIVAYIIFMAWIFSYSSY